MARGGARFTAGGPGGGNGGFEDVFSSMFGGGGGGGARRALLHRRRRPARPRGHPRRDVRRRRRPGLRRRAGSAPRRDRAAGADLTARTSPVVPRRGRGCHRHPEHAAAARSPRASRPGVKDGQRIRLRGKGQPGEAGAPAGDLMLTVTVEQHPVFGRDGDNLTVDLPVTFAEATLGATVAVPTLDGGPVKVRDRPGHARAAGCCGSRVAGSAARARRATCSPRSVVVVPQRLSDEAQGRGRGAQGRRTPATTPAPSCSARPRTDRRWRGSASHPTTTTRSSSSPSRPRSPACTPRRCASTTGSVW